MAHYIFLVIVTLTHISWGKPSIHNLVGIATKNNEMEKEMAQLREEITNLKTAMHPGNPNFLGKIYNSAL